MYRTALSLFLLSTVPLATQAAAKEVYLDESRKAVAEFSAALKAELESALYTAGPVKAIEVCQLKAPGIAAQVSKDRGFRIARTSLKLRNPANAPDPWEQGILEQFQAQQASGADPRTLEYSAMVEENGKQMFRYMKAIPTQGVCLACHGEQISPEVRSTLQRLYPEDRARGFKYGELRGAFTITRVIP